MENKFQFYNTLTRKVETVIPHEDGKIGMYTCGPTYTISHISATSEVTSWRMYWKNHSAMSDMM